jgi:hypothetical protein
LSVLLFIVPGEYKLPKSVTSSLFIVPEISVVPDKYAKSKLSSILKSFDKNDLRERFKLDPDICILQYVVDILDINLLIFVMDDEIYIL